VTTERQHVNDYMMRVLMILAVFTAVTMSVTVVYAKAWPWLYFFAPMSVVNGAAVAYYHDKITRRGGRKH
jgi:hypothetical protein